MPELVGSLGTARDQGKGTAAAGAHSAKRSVTGASGAGTAVAGEWSAGVWFAGAGFSGAGFASAQPELAWQTPIGQILFLQSVDDERA